MQQLQQAVDCLESDKQRSAAQLQALNEYVSRVCRPEHSKQDNPADQDGPGQQVRDDWQLRGSCAYRAPAVPITQLASPDYTGRCILVKRPISQARIAARRGQ